MSISWWDALSNRTSGKRRPGRPHVSPKKPPSRQLFLEPLEDRCVPATFNVNTLADLSLAAGVNPNGTIVGQGNTVTLRSAIQAANNTPGGNTINLTVAGDYKLTLVGTPGETDNQAGELAILPNGGNLILQNTSGGTAVIDGNNAVRDLDINPGNTDNPATKGTVTIAGVTITNGIAQPNDFAAGSGGGIRDQGNISLTLNNDLITNNFATADGGGVSMENSPASTPWALTLNNTTVSDNHAGDAGGGVETDGKGKVVINGGQITGNSTVNQGGGVWLDATADGVASVTITDPGTGYTAAPTVTFSAPQNAGGTTATGVATITGGVVTGVTITNPGSGYTAAPTVTFSPPPAGTTATGTPNLGFLNSASLAITGTLINDNSAYMVDGGIGNAGNGAVTITDSTVEHNFSAGNGGGFGDQNNLGTLTVTGSYFLDNSAVGDGGGIQEGGPSTTITDTEIKGNSSNASGGGVFANGAVLTITDSTIAGNTAAVTGGGLELEMNGTMSFIENTTIANNRVLSNGQVGDGGGINITTALTGVLTLLNDTVSGNFADNGGGVFWNVATGSAVEVENTIIAQNSASVLGPDAVNTSDTFSDFGGNIIGVSGAGGGNTGFTAVTTHTGTVGTPLNPQLGPLTDNLGPLVGASGASIVLETEAINGGSPAFDKGVAGLGVPTTDERGFPRTDAGANEKPDVGAFEFQDAIVAAEVPGSGVFLYTQATGSFQPLTTANATLLAANASGQVAAEFPGYGVFLYSGGVWTSLTPFNATLLGIDAAGDVFAKIPGYNLQVDRGGVWTFLPGNTVGATLLAVDARGDVATEIPGYGVFFLPNGGSNFIQLTPANASVLAIDNNGDVFADLAGAGVFRYSGGVWTQLTTQNATLLSADALGDVAGDFAGYGVLRFTAATSVWTSLGTPDASALSMDDGGDIFASFPGQGVTEYTFANGVVQVTTQHASVLSAS